MKYLYFVSYTYQDFNSFGFGNTTFNTDRLIETNESVHLLNDYLKNTFCKGKEVVVLSFQLLKKGASNE